MSFPPATEMFQFAGFASRTYGFSPGSPSREGLPHSEIPGSTIARISPGLFAACHVLHRLSVPRHPPDALIQTLDRSTRRLQGKTPQANKSRMKTLSKKSSAVSYQLSAKASSSLPLHSVKDRGRACAQPILLLPIVLTLRA